MHTIGVEITPVQVLRTTPTATNASLLAHHFGEEGTDITAISNEMPMTTMIAEDHIPGLKMAEYPHRVGLLAQVSMRGAVENTLGKVLKDGFLETADGVEKAIKVLVLAHQAELYFRRGKGSLHLQ